MATLQSLRALGNYQYLNNGDLPVYFPQKPVQTPLERYGRAMRYATNIVQYYKENYSYPDIQYINSTNFKDDGHFGDNSIGK